MISPFEVGQMILTLDVLAAEAVSRLEIVRDTLVGYVDANLIDEELATQSIKRLNEAISTLVDEDQEHLPELSGITYKLIEQDIVHELLTKPSAEGIEHK